MFLKTMLILDYGCEYFRILFDCCVDFHPNIAVVVYLIIKYI